MMTEWHREIVCDKVIQAFKSNQSTRLIRICFESLTEYKNMRLDKEKLNGLAQRFYHKEVMRKGLHSLKLQATGQVMDPIVEDAVFEEAKEKINAKRLMNVFEGWRDLFYDKLRPKWVQDKQLQVIGQKFSQRYLFAILKINKATVEEEKNQLKIIHGKSILKTAFREWKKTAVDNKKTQKFIERKLSQRLLKNVFKGFKRVLILDKKEKAAEAHQQRIDQIRMLKMAEAEENYRKSAFKKELIQIEQAEKFRSRILKKKAMKELRSGCIISKQLNKLANIARDKLIVENFNFLKNYRQFMERQKAIQEALPGLKNKYKVHRKRLILGVLQLCASKSKVQKSKYDNFQSQKRLTVLKKCLRGFKRNLVEKITNQIKQGEKATFLDEAQQRKNEQYRVKVKNENEFLKTSNSNLQQSVLEKNNRLIYLKQSAKALDDKKLGLLTKIEIMEKQMSQNMSKGANDLEALESLLNEKLVKAERLKREVKSMQEEIQDYDTQIEETNKQIRETTRDVEILNDKIENSDRDYKNETDSNKTAVSELEHQIVEEEAIIDALTDIRTKKEQEIAHLSRLMIKLKAQKAENLKASRNTISRMENDIRSIENKNMKLAGESDGLRRTQNVLEGTPATVGAMREMNRKISKPAHESISTPVLKVDGEHRTARSAYNERTNPENLDESIGIDYIYVPPSSKSAFPSKGDYFDDLEARMKRLQMSMNAEMMSKTLK